MNTHNSTAEIQFLLHAAGGAPGGAGSVKRPASGNGRLPRLTQVMALAIQFQDMILRGEARDYADLARLGCLTRERMSQIMKLIWLAPDIQQEILEFPLAHQTRFPIGEVAARKIASFLTWEAQRQRWRELKQIHHL
jgi:hypothetical protein